MKNRTVWTNREAKLTPRNKQAALLLSKPHPIHMPPVEEKQPTYGMTLAQKARFEQEARITRIIELKKESDARKLEVKTLSDKRRAKLFRRKMLRYKSHQNKKLKRVADKIAKKLASRA